MVELDVLAEITEKKLSSRMDLFICVLLKELVKRMNRDLFICAL